MTVADPAESPQLRGSEMSRSFRRRSAPVSWKSLKSLKTPVRYAGSAPVAPVYSKSLTLLNTPVRAGLRHCVPHTPLRMRAPLGRRASVTKGSFSRSKLSGKGLMVAGLLVAARRVL
jgi:hypothetical protein